MLLDWLQICPIKGIFSGFSELPTNHQELDDIRRGQVVAKGAGRTVEELFFQMGDQAITQWHRDPLDNEINYEESYSQEFQVLQKYVYLITQFEYEWSSYIFLIRII